MLLLILAGVAVAYGVVMLYTIGLCKIAANADRHEARLIAATLRSAPRPPRD